MSKMLELAPLQLSFVHSNISKRWLVSVFEAVR